MSATDRAVAAEEVGLTDAELQTIETILGAAGPDASLRSELQQILRRYIAEKGERKPPRPSAVRRELTAIADAVDRLIARLVPLVDDAAPIGRDAAFGLFIASGRRWDAENLSRLGMDLADFRQEASRAAAQVGQDKGGPTTDVGRHFLSTKLSVLYTNITGQAPTVTNDIHRDEIGGKFIGLIQLIEGAAARVMGSPPPSKSQVAHFVLDQLRSNRAAKGTNPNQK